MPGGLGVWGDLRGVYAPPPKALLPQSFLLFLLAHGTLLRLSIVW
jgi:hypothetical protein